jgi:hypothetical protein
MCEHLGTCVTVEQLLAGWAERPWNKLGLPSRPDNWEE